MSIDTFATDHPSLVEWIVLGAFIAPLVSFVLLTVIATYGR
jgi:hypothetical protein